MNEFADYQRFAATARSSLEGGLALVQDQAPRPETIRLLRILSRDAWYVASSEDWDKAERYAQSAVAMAEQVESPEELSSALEALAIVYSARGLYRENVEICLRRLELSRDPHFTDYRERVNIHYQLGRALLAVGDYETALTHAAEAERLSAAVQDITTQVNAMTLQNQGLFPWDRLDEDLSLRTRLVDLLWLGLPPVVTEGGSMAQVVRRTGAGETVPAGDARALAAAVRRLLLDDDRRHHMSEAGRRWAADRQWGRVAAPLLDFADRPRRDPHRDRFVELAPAASRAREPIGNRLLRRLRRVRGGR